MGRNKSELKTRDKYAELYASVLIAEAVIDHHFDGQSPIIKIETEDIAEWDDIVQKQANETHRHQIKRQLTDLKPEDFAKCIKSMNCEETVQYHFAVPAPISVKGVGELRILKELCRRLQQSRVNIDEVVDSLQRAESKWVQTLQEWTQENVTEIFEKLQCLHIDFIGFEPELNDRAVRALKYEFGDNARNALDKICNHVSTIDGVVDIKAEDVRKKLPSPNSNKTHLLYWSLIRQAEKRLWISRWWGLTEVLMSNVVPEPFHDDILQFCLKVSTVVWPGACEPIESAIKNVAARVSEYRRHFCLRCTAAPLGNRLVEDKSYKLNGFNQTYIEEVSRSEAWHKGNQIRLFNLVVALNELFDQVKTNLDSEYRLADGKLGIYDEIGAFQPDAETVYFPESYLPVD